MMHLHIFVLAFWQNMYAMSRLLLGQYLLFACGYCRPHSPKTHDVMSQEQRFASSPCLLFLVSSFVSPVVVPIDLP